MSKKLELFTSMQGWEAAADAIIAQSKRLLETLLNFRMSDIPQAKRTLTKWFFVDWDYED